MGQRLEKIDGSEHERSAILRELDAPGNLFVVPWLEILVGSGFGIPVSRVEKIVGIEPISLAGDGAIFVVDLATSDANHVDAFELYCGMAPIAFDERAVGTGKRKVKAVEKEIDLLGSERRTSVF